MRKSIMRQEWKDHVKKKRERAMRACKMGYTVQYTAAMH
jgi:hypothetical protein